MNYSEKLYEIGADKNPEYPFNDIGISKLFYDLHKEILCYVIEAKAWYQYDGKRWIKDDDGLKVMEMCKEFVQDYYKYMDAFCPFDEECLKFSKGLINRRKREGILYDSRSIKPLSLSQFDWNKMLFNCRNGTYNLATMSFQPHNPNDYITKISRAKYEAGFTCQRWEQFINEIMCGDVETARFL